MRHHKQGRKLNRTASHRKALMMNMASSLVLYKRIRTTDAKAKELRSYVERLVTYAKKESLQGRRLIQQKIPGTLGKKVANILIHEIAPEFKNRAGGYTRIIKLGNRKNDNAPVSLIEFVGFENLIEEEVIEAEVVESEES
jgi:large subunit ribosomal protein L17